MLKLVFYTNDRRLKVRLAFPEDDFTHAIKWKDLLTFIISPSGDFMMTWTSLLPDLDPEYAEALIDLVGARYPVSPDFEKLKSLSPEIVFQNGTQEWVFFGGSFNPWHKGHQACIALLPEDKVCFIVPDRNPHKETYTTSPVATVLEISTHSKLGKHQFIVPTFLLSRQKNPTVDWMEKLKDNFPTLKCSLLMGFDSFSNLKSWTRASDLVPLLDTIYVVSRLEEDKERLEALDHAHALGPDLNVVFLGKHEFEDISSTEIRMKNQ